jgi:Spy/CpxP family protein refolding chaperone
MINKMISSRVLAVAASVMLGLGMVAAPSQAKDASEKPAAVPSTIDWKSLNLSADQIKKINILRIAFNKKAIGLKATAQLKQLEIQKQLMSPAANPSLVRKLLEEKLVLDSQLQKESLDHFLAIRALLTPTQIAKLPGAVALK